MQWTTRFSTGQMRATLFAGLCLALPLVAGSGAQAQNQPQTAQPPAQTAPTDDGGSRQQVDVSLVLAVDISYSMDPDELELQRQGYIQALKSPEFQEAVRKGVHGRVAIAYLEWAGPQSQYLIAPFMIIDGPETTAELASTIARAPLRRAYRTSISAAIDRSVELLEQSNIDALREVIDVSGDGPNNQGRVVTQARDDAVAKGISINGLPVMVKRPGYLDLDNLDDYYRACVIGGPGSFVIPIYDKAQFADAIRTKLVLEIAGQFPPRQLFDHAQQGSDQVNCTAGERQWRPRMDN